jgi:hypothetical protein
LRKRTFALSGGRCCVFPWLRANDLDHLSYFRLSREQPLRDVVPLSRIAHRIVTALRQVLGCIIGRRLGYDLVNFPLRMAFGVAIVIHALLGIARR